MKKLFTLLFVFIFFAGQDGYGDELFTGFQDGKPASWEVVKHDGMLVNKECIENIQTCQALHGHKLTVIRLKNPSPLAGHPASNHCMAIGQRSKILVNEKKQQFNFCMFADGTIISSWDLYEMYTTNSAAN